MEPENTDTALLCILNELMSNDKYRLNWTYDYPELSIVIGINVEDKL